MFKNKMKKLQRRLRDIENELKIIRNANSVEALEITGTVEETVPVDINAINRELQEMHNEENSTFFQDFASAFAHAIDDEDEPEMVDHPDHYNDHPSGIECIDVVEHMSFNLGSAMKYIWRSGLKESAPTDQDLAKALWYIERERALLAAEEATRVVSKIEQVFGLTPEEALKIHQGLGGKS